MRIGVVFLNCLVIVTFALKADPVDSLLKFSDLTFKTDFERSAFKRYQQLGRNTNVLDLFLNSFSGSLSINRTNANEQVDNAVNYLKKETEGQTDEKRVKTIYKYIHQRFFSMYKLRNSFTDIFERGEYNCVSASAMYAIVFSKMNIPYLVMEAPQHVYLIAYPNTHKILIESTSPANGYFIFKDSYTQRFVKYLHEAKLITEDEFRSKTPEELFNKYYYDKNGLSILDLAGVQYCNYSVYFSDDNDNEQALDEVKKAYYLWPAEKTRYVLQWVLSYVVSNCEYKTEKDVQRLKLLCRFNNANDEEISDETIRYEFGRLMKAQLTANSDYEMMDRSFKAISPAINDSALRNDIAFGYHYELSRLGFLNFKDKEYEMQHLKAAYTINPRHADLRTIIKSYFVRLIDKNSDPRSITKNLDEFTTLFDFLATDNDFNSVRANCILELAYQSFTLNEVGKGEKYLRDFELFCKPGGDVKPSERFVEMAYASVASYYYKKGNSTKTREFLKKGISYAPENFGLHTRLSQVH